MLKPVPDALSLYPPPYVGPVSLQFENVGSEETEDGQWIRVLQLEETPPVTDSVLVASPPGHTESAAGLLHSDGQRDVSG